MKYLVIKHFRNKKEKPCENSRKTLIQNLRQDIMPLSKEKCEANKENILFLL